VQASRQDLVLVKLGTMDARSGKAEREFGPISLIIQPINSNKNEVFPAEYFKKRSEN